MAPAWSTRHAAMFSANFVMLVAALRETIRARSQVGKSLRSSRRIAATRSRLRHVPSRASARTRSIEEPSSRQERIV
jgi:hypothetical protein